MESLLSAPHSPGRKVRWERKPAQSPQARGPQAPALSSHSPTLTPAGTAQGCPLLPRPWLWSLWPGPYRKGPCPPPLPIQPGGGSGHTWHWGSGGAPRGCCSHIWGSDKRKAGQDIPDHPPCLSKHGGPGSLPPSPPARTSDSRTSVGCGRLVPWSGVPGLGYCP